MTLADSEREGVTEQIDVRIVYSLHSGFAVPEITDVGTLDDLYDNWSRFVSFEMRLFETRTRGDGSDLRRITLLRRIEKRTAEINSFGLLL